MKSMVFWFWYHTIKTAGVYGMYIYLVRHGETEWNSAGRVQGREDIELNANGIRQAESLAGAFAGVALDAVISSPLSRAKKTAVIVADTKGLPVFVEPQLIERDYGALSGKAVRSEDKQSLFMDMDIPGLERMDDVAGRMLGVIERFAKTDYQRILMVSHGAAINSVLSALSKGEIGSGRTWLVNACINVLACGGGEIRIERYNLSHEAFAAYVKQQKGKKPCVRCLLLESSQKEAVEKIRRLIELMPETEKASEETYRKRLLICQGCDALMDGQCRKCGCYVELRAAKKNAGCPGELHLW